MKKVLAVLLVVGMLSVLVQAEPLYVDASTSNTVRANDGDPDAWWTTATSPDGLWGMRTGFANNDNFVLGTPGNEIFEASGTGSGAEDCVAIMTTVSGLITGQKYDVSVVYWSPDSQNWNVRAGFALESLIFFDREGADGAIAGTWTGKQESDRKEFTALIGQIAADNNGLIKVYIDDKPGTGFADRTWYDGLLVTAVPEPATMLLLGLGGLALRQRKR